MHEPPLYFFTDTGRFSALPVSVKKAIDVLSMGISQAMFIENTLLYSFSILKIEYELYARFV